MLSVIMLVAYDYRYAYNALQRVYGLADEIILGLDEDRISWSQRPFSFARDEFGERIRRMDPLGKIRIEEGNFHGGTHPLANETSERNLLSRLCRPGNWILQIDSDEYVLNPAQFLAWLPSAALDRDFKARWITVFKSFGDQCLVVQEPAETIEVGTRARGDYVYGRRTRVPADGSPLQLLHHSWGRTRDELEQKLLNWGHSRDFDVARFLAFWDGITLDNYRAARNFHPLHGPLWGRLGLIQLPKGMQPGAPEPLVAAPAA